MSDTERWCLGCKSAGQREFTPEEVCALGKTRRRMIINAWTALLGYPVLLGLSTVFVFIPLLDWTDGLYGSDSAPSVLVVSVFVFVCGFCGIAGAFLYFRDKMKLARRFKEDLRAGYIVRFESPDKKIWVEVLSAASAVYRSNLENVPVWMSITISDIAPDAHQRMTAPVSNEFTASLDDPNLELRQRPFSSEERRELDGHLLRFTVRPWWVWVFLLWIYGGTSAFAYRAFTGTLSPLNRLSAAFYMILFTITTWRLIQNRQYISRMRDDLAGGKFLVIHNNSSLDQPGSFTSVEILPTLKFIWSADGEPAPWRLKLTETETSLDNK